VTSEDAQNLLARFRRGQVSTEDVLNAFCAAPFVDLGFAHVDTHRAMRTGFPEVVYAAGKSPDQVAAIARTTRAS
jgi:pyridinium-3,5-biscarboxylic acid mononucleotide synthase